MERASRAAFARRRDAAAKGLPAAPADAADGVFAPGGVSGAAGVAMFGRSSGHASSSESSATGKVKRG